MRVIIAAAGTGGHINPGIAIANKIKKEQPDSKIIFIGTSRGLENDLVPRAGYELKTIDAYGLSKEISIDNLKKIIKTFKGLKQARKILKDFNPDIVIGTGGYICGAVVLAANKYKVPCILHESNAFPGKAVKMLASKVNTILVGFEDAKKRLPKSINIVVTGTPTKMRDLHYTKEEKDNKKKDLGFDTRKPIVLFFGGSQGAKAINDALLPIITEKRNTDYQIMWASGPKQYDIIKENLENQNININNIANVRIVPYIYNMEETMNVSDIIVARSGAITITEIGIVGKPAIFIPLPDVSENHQEYNANVLKNKGAAKIILNKDLNSETLNTGIQDMLKDDLELMGQKAKEIAIQNVEDKIYTEITKLLQRS